MMNILGAVLIVLGCSTVGFLMASEYLREISVLRNLISILEYWKNAIDYHHTTLPELCKRAEETDTIVLKDFFKRLQEQFSNTQNADASQCAKAALLLCPNIPKSCEVLLLKLSTGLGMFDATGQIHEIDSILDEAQHTLSELLQVRDQRIKTYKTFGICIGIAIAILII